MFPRAAADASIPGEMAHVQLVDRLIWLNVLVCNLVLVLKVAQPLVDKFKPLLAAAAEGWAREVTAEPVVNADKAEANAAAAFLSCWVSPSKRPPSAGRSAGVKQTDTTKPSVRVDQITFTALGEVWSPLLGPE